MAGISAKDVKALRVKTGAGMMDCKKALTDADGDVDNATDLLRERGLAKAGKRAGRETGEGSVGIATGGGKGTIVEIGCETDFVARNDKFQALVQQVTDAIAAAGVGDDLGKALAAPCGDSTVDGVIQASVAVVGENMELKRVASLETAGTVSSYVHGGGSLGVLVAIETSSPDAYEDIARDLAMHVAAADPTPLAVDRDGVDASVVEKEREILRNQALESGKPEKIVDNIVNGRINKFYAEHCLTEQPFVKDPDTKVGDMVSGAGDGKIAGFVRFKLGEATEQ